jgi:uracil-DNA glycosylase family 4
VPDPVSGIAERLRMERELFGEDVIADRSRSGKEDAMTKAKLPADADEPMLFPLPAPARASLPSEPWSSTTTLEELDESINTCAKCPLGTTRTKFVFGVGNPHATLMLIGEAPGADEDAQGEPFVGRAGQLLNKILEAIHFRREDVYICNILKCRPPNNRKPLPEEAEHCIPYLRKQVELIQPKLILCLGLTAAENLLGTRESLTQLRGRVLSYEGIPMMVTYHPAALLRNPNWKRPAWDDVQAVRKLHDELAAKHSV